MPWEAVTMAGPPTVSVVIPARDDAPALARCLDALAAQRVRPAEVVVVDNGSRDATAAVAAARGARVVSEPLPGIPAAAAAGYDAARAEVIARLDADSVPGPDWVGRVAAVMADPRVDAVTGWGRFYGLGTAGRAATQLYLGAYYVLGLAALGHPPLWGSNMAVRRSTWEQVRGEVHRHDQELHDDMDLAFVLGPRRVVRLDRRLTVAVSGRSVRGAAQVRRRFRRAFNTLGTNWRVAPPWERWAARLAPAADTTRRQP
ncbi:glycosyltransferase family 2 protein [Georgenia sp. AZ-5]|uniref:glycosyltransferase family 2 protein n=1 Tax=Georgenia sp. AZ-5 TaxID=3367526 RepID=UPI003754D3D8